MLLQSLKKQWKAIEEIGSDAEKRGKVLGIEPSWQPELPEVRVLDGSQSTPPKSAKSRSGLQKLRDMRLASTRTVVRKRRKTRAAG